MRKLPIYILIDSSESMIGEAIDAVQKDVELMISTLRRDPYALEVAAISIISFNGKATVLTPLTELDQFKTPHIRLGADAGTSLGAAFDLLSARIRLEVVKTTETRRSDYRPIVFLLTSSFTIDDWNNARDYASKAKFRDFYALIYGWNAFFDLSEKSPAPHFIRIDKRYNGKGLLESVLSDVFRKWSFELSTSYSRDYWDFERSTCKEEYSNVDDLPPPPPEVERFMSVLANKHTHGSLVHSLTLRAKCASKEKELFITFELDSETQLYTKANVYTEANVYTMKGTDFDVPRVSSNFLCAHIPPCPYCGNDWIICGNCGNFYCDPVNPNSTTTCPLCGVKGLVSYNGATIDVIAKNSCGVAYGHIPYGGAIIDVWITMR